MIGAFGPRAVVTIGASERHGDGAQRKGYAGPAPVVALASEPAPCPFFRPRAFGYLQRKKLGPRIAHEFDNTDSMSKRSTCYKTGVVYPRAFTCHPTQGSIQFTEEVAP